MMTVIGRDLYTEDMIPGYRYRLSACPRCQATTLDEAAAVCRPWQDQNGEYSCPGDDSMHPFDVKWDARGRACELTRKSARVEARKHDEWYAEFILEEAEKERRRNEVAT